LVWIKFSGFTPDEIYDDIASSCSQSSTPTADDSTADALAESLTFRNWSTFSDVNIIFYVSGTIAPSVAKTLKCADCNEAPVDPEHLLEPLQLQQDEPQGHFIPATFLDAINRGGLSRPSEYCY
jgi:hypothetical protein